MYIHIYTYIYIYVYARWGKETCKKRKKKKSWDRWAIVRGRFAGVLTSRGGGRLGRRSASQPCHTRTDGRSTPGRRLRPDSVHPLGKRRDAWLRANVKLAGTPPRGAHGGPTKFLHGSFRVIAHFVILGWIYPFRLLMRIIYLLGIYDKSTYFPCSNLMFVIQVYLEIWIKIWVKIRSTDSVWLFSN